MRIGISIVSTPSSAGPIIKRIRRSVAQDILGSKLKFCVVPPEEVIVQMETDLGADPIDDLYEAAGIAEERLEKNEDDLHA